MEKTEGKMKDTFEYLNTFLFLCLAVSAQVFELEGALLNGGGMFCQAFIK